MKRVAGENQRSAPVWVVTPQVIRARFPTIKLQDVIFNFRGFLPVSSYRSIITDTLPTYVNAAGQTVTLTDPTRTLTGRSAQMDVP